MEKKKTLRTGRESMNQRNHRTNLPQLMLLLLHVRVLSLIQQDPEKRRETNDRKERLCIHETDMLQDNASCRVELGCSPLKTKKAEYFKTRTVE